MIESHVPTGTEFADLVPALRRDLPWASVSLPVTDGKPAGDTPAAQAAADPPARSFLELLDDWAATRPDHVALAHAERTVTYQSLNSRTTRLAHLLRLRGVEPGQVVPVVLDRGVLFFETAVALWKLRAGFLPVDPGWPAPWRDGMIARTGSPLCLTSAAGPALPPGSRYVEVDTLDLDTPPDDSAPRVGHPLRPGDVAYAIRTSGSTGEPKLVVVEHRGLTNLIAAQRAELAAMDGSAVVLQFCSPYFDSMIFEWAMAIGSGGRLEIVDAHDLVSTPVQEFLGRLRITHTCLPAVVVRMMTPSALPSLRVLVSSGDVCLPATARLWAGKVQLVNGYGPTETTVCATMHTVAPDETDDAVVPIGRPLAGTTVTIVDEKLNRVPDGVAGEILIGGAGVARGYLGRPDLTAERFLPDLSTSGGRLYRTGDLGRHRPDGTIEFLGRTDDQVKVRGFRVEPAEIEHTLALLDGVRDAVVVADQTRLTGYVRLSPGCAMTGADLRERSARVLPGHLVPDRIVIVTQWPLRPNGKIDRSRLPSAPPPRDTPITETASASISRSISASASASTESLERIIGDIAAELLGVTGIGAHESLFDWGCNSLTAVQLAARVTEVLGRSLPVSAVLRGGTVAAIAAELADATGRAGRTGHAGHAPSPLPAHVPPAVSHAQERIWFAQGSAAESVAYNGQCVLRLAGTMDRTALNASLTEIVRRHDVLRSRLTLGDSGLEMSVVPPWRVDVPVVDLTALDPAERDARVADCVREAVREPFDVRSDRLVRWLLIRTGADEHLLVHTEHHSVHDAWAFNVFLHDLVAAYDAYLRHGSATLPPLPLQYQDYARWHRGWCESPESAEQRAYWASMLVGAPAILPLPSRSVAPARRGPTPGGRDGAAPRLRVDRELARELEDFGRRHGATLYMITLSAYLVVLHRMSGARDLLVATGAACRTWQNTQDLLGMFINTVVIRGDLGDDPTLAETVRRVRGTCLSAYDHQELPLEEVIAGLEVPRTPGINPLVQAAFNFHESQPKSLDSVPFDITVIDGMNNGTTKFDLSVTVFPSYASPGHISRYEGALLHIPRSDTAVHPSPLDALSGLDVVWKYDTALFGESQVLGMLAAYREVLRTMAAVPETRLSEIDVRHLLGDLPDEPEVPRVRQRADDHRSVRRRPGSGEPGGTEAGGDGTTLAVIIRIVGDVLGVSAPHGHDNFFELGGNSLAAVRFLATVRKEFGVSLKLEDVLADPTIGAIAELVDVALGDRGRG